MHYRNIVLSMMMSSTLLLGGCVSSTEEAENKIDIDNGADNDTFIDSTEEIEGNGVVSEDSTSNASNIENSNDNNINSNDLITDSSSADNSNADSASSNNTESDNASNEIPHITLAELTQPQSGTTIGSSIIFSSSHHQDVWLYIGSTRAGKDIYNAALTSATTIKNLPEDGSTIYVTLWTQIEGKWNNREYQFTTDNQQENIVDNGASSANNGDTSDSHPSTPKVLVLGLDGVQFEKIALTATPNIDSLNITRAFAGGISATATQQQTYSGPGWSSLMTGVWADQHRITGNNSGQAVYPSVLARLEQELDNPYTASIWNWPNPNNNFFAADKSVVDMHRQRLTDTQVINETRELILNQGYDMVFAALDGPDHVGHAEGFSANYLHSISTADQQLGSLLNAIEIREQQYNEDWLVMVVTDHGRAGYGSAHGGQSEQERTVFIASNKNLQRSCSADDALASCPSQVDVTPSVLAHMNINIEASWKLAGSSLFGEPQTAGQDNQQSKANSDVANYRHWAIGGPSQILIPAAGISGLTQLNGQNVAHLRARINRGSYTEMSVPINPYLSGDPFSDPAVDISNSRWVKLTYKSNHQAILQLRQSGVHGGSHNQAALPASPNSFTSITLDLATDFKWLGNSASTLDLSRVGKFNFAFLAQNETDAYAEIIVSSLEIEHYQPQQ